MKKIFTLLLTGFVLVQCTIDRSIEPLNAQELLLLENFQGLDKAHQVQISPADEPGQQLWLCLTFVSKDDQSPLENQTISLYHTSSEGTYDPSNPADESTARLNGSLITNEKGQVFVSTILPGDYGSSDDNRHIHTSVKNASPEAYDIHFKQYSGFMGKKFISNSDQHFLADLKRYGDEILIAFLTIKVKSPKLQTVTVSQELPSCEWCGANEAPDEVKWESIIASQEVEGERMILEGKVYNIDGKTPAEDIIIYAYHTNNKGLYEKLGSETGNGLRHGYLRGWAKTNSEGRYRFHTIVPAPYPNQKEPAHVHMTLLGENFEEYWINATWFKGDKIITDEMIKNLKRTGGFSNIIELNKNEQGAWVGTRDIILNPPTD